MFITNDIKYIGVNERNTDLFEGQFEIPDGISYNSYIITDEKIAVMDTADKNFSEEWFSNLENALDRKAPDYLIVHHMEPDHSANVDAFLRKYPSSQVVATAKAFNMMKSFFGNDYADRRIVVGEGDTLNLGEHTLTFLTAPMVHWPEVMVSYDGKDKVVFSADGFGKFGAIDTDAAWACEARRYYFGIVGKYGAQVQALLKKISNLDIQIICPLHGPVLTENLGYYIDLYNTWSSYGAESDGIVIAYTSVYGNTKAAAELLKKKLEEKGCPNVVINDLARCDIHEAIEDAFRYGKIVLATTTYNGDIFPKMKEFIENLSERNYQNRTVAFIENGSWAPVAAKVMRKMLEGAKNITFTENNIQIKSALNDESRAAVDALCDELLK